MPEATIHIGDCIDSMRKMPDASVHCCVTSPPYWGLRDYGVDGQTGLEDSPGAYVEKMVDTFREVRRVLRGDGTAWINIGDSYASGGRGSSDRHRQKVGANTASAQALGPKTPPPGCKPKDLVGIPWRVAFALQADGWYLRSDIIWSKPNTMPESVTDRPTRSHEYIFLLAKSEKYYYDHESIKEESVSDHPSGNGYGRPEQISRDGRGNVTGWVPTEKRNKRDVWTINTIPFPEAHFAVYPPTLIEPCILAGTSDKGCCAACGAPWERVVDVIEPAGHKPRLDEKRFKCGSGEHPSSVRKFKGWASICDCNAEPIPCTVLDPFGGAGTSALVALAKGRNAILCELNPEYAEMARRRVESDAPMFNKVKIAA